MMTMVFVLLLAMLLAPLFVSATMLLPLVAVLFEKYLMTSLFLV